jgi:PhoPQ-activated pathogenicity-related protein
MLRYFSLLALGLAGCQQATTPSASAQIEAALPPTPAPKTQAVTLDTFLQKPEPAFKWSDSSQFAGDGFANLRLVSQTWQGRDWSHRLQIFKPTRVDFPDAAVINISYGSGSFGESILGQGLADISGAYTVNAFNVPNQPLYDREEDALVAYSFQKYLETGDPSWPLLLPMTKSVVKAMDAVQQWSKKTTGKEIKRFIVAGASKRGWTAYLVAAGDKRVVGCVPIVYDNLNIPAQIKHQHDVWGETSQLAVAFSDLGLMDEGKTGSTRGKQLLQAVDPYSYLKRLTMPVFSINATNDGYWPHDAQTVYRDELSKQTSLSTYYAPNSTHFLGSQIIPLAQSSAVWTRLVLSGAKIPTVGLRREANAFRASTSGEAASVVLWLAQNKTRDFRHAHWVSIVMKKTPKGWEAPLADAKLQPFGCAFAQAQWSEKGTDSPLVLASPMWTNSEGVLMARAF